jgi:hypothetical protein
MQDAPVKGRYVNGTDMKHYTFLGTLKVDGNNFSGLINDGRCPARVAGNFEGGLWDFTKTYSADESILKEELFKGTHFPDTHLAAMPEIKYHGRAIKALANGVAVRGFYNSAIAKSDIQGRIFDDFVRKLALTDYAMHPMTSKYPILEAYNELGAKAVPFVGQWAMRVTTQNPEMTRVGPKNEEPNYRLTI